MKLRILKRLNIQQRNRKKVPANEFKNIRNKHEDQSNNTSRNLANGEQVSEEASTISLPNGWEKKKLDFVKSSVLMILSFIIYVMFLLVPF